jgi:phage gp36-like protein
MGRKAEQLDSAMGLYYNPLATVPFHTLVILCCLIIRRYLLHTIQYNRYVSNVCVPRYGTTVDDRAYSFGLG